MILYKIYDFIFKTHPRDIEIRQVKAAIKRNENKIDSMAKTNESTEWTPERVREAVTAGTTEEKLQLLKRIGVLKADGSLNDPQKSWGMQPSRTPDLDEK